MGNLRERTNYFKVVDGKIEDADKDGRWIDVVETEEGGAKIRIKADDLECLDRVSTKLMEIGKIVEGVVNEQGDEIILVDYVGKQIPFTIVMKALFD